MKTVHFFPSDKAVTIILLILLLLLTSLTVNRSSMIIKNQINSKICHLYYKLNYLPPKILSLYPSLTSVSHIRL